MTLISKCIFEFLGALVLILFGDGVCCAVSLDKSKAQGAGWTVVTLGWGYSWIPVAGPMLGGLFAALTFLLVY